MHSDLLSMLLRRCKVWEQVRKVCLPALEERLMEYSCLMPWIVAAIRNFVRPTVDEGALHF